MFERYTERARRVIFFARYEAAQVGSTTIEAEHLLLGLTREDKDVFNRFLPGSVDIDTIRTDVIMRLSVREKKTTSIDLPLSNESKGILAWAAEEAGHLGQLHIGTEHLLLGILKAEASVAAQVLCERGMQLQAIRDELARQPMPGESGTFYSPLEAKKFRNPALPKGGIVRDSETATRIAEAVWIPLYGADVVEGQKPLKAELKFNTVWIVSGSTTKQGEEPLSAFILKMDGRILAVGRDLPAAEAAS